MNDAMQLYLNIYYVIDSIDHLLNETTEGNLDYTFMVGSPMNFWDSEISCLIRCAFINQQTEFIQAMQA
eukprot:2135019-Ditylum_brightwellii.AAC.1